MGEVMSRAFVKENDGDLPEELPERPVSEHPNFVTPRGLKLIEDEVHRLEGAREKSLQAEEKSVQATIDRDLRYWRQRRATARLVNPAAQPSKVRFGMHVRLQHSHSPDTREFKLVGEDEASPGNGLISWVSPVGQQLLGREVGDEVNVLQETYEVVEIRSDEMTR